MFGFPRPQCRRFVRWFSVCLFCVVTSGQVVCRADPTEDLEYRDHVFFLGLDIFVLQPEGFLPVEGFERGQVKVTADGTSRIVKLKKLEDVDSKIQPKVSSGSVILGEVQGYRTYSPENDPTLRAVRTQSRMIADEMQRESEYTGNLGNQTVAAEKMSEIAATSTDPAVVQAAGQIAANIDSHIDAMSRGIGSADSLDALADAANDDGSASDAYAVTCTVSSEEPVENAYAVLVTNLLFPDAATPIRSLAFEKLPEIDDSPRKVKFVQKWLPVGYQVDGYEIHTYREDGSEIATNLSGKRAPLSRAEAFEFLLFQYTTANRLENLEARPVRELLPPDLPLIFPRKQLGRTAHLSIDDHGGVSNVQLEGGAADSSDAFIEEALRNVYFFPALAFGEPVESEITVTLGDLIR